MAARILPLVLMLLFGGVVGDRLGSRQAMLMADAVRCLTQLGLVAVLLDGEPHLWTLVGLVALWGAAEALFTPALGALVPHIVRPDALSDANALLEVTRSATSIAGPVLAGLLTAVVDASTVLTLDAASYAVSMVALLLLPRATRSTIAAASFFGELAEGWAEFRSRTWLWVTTVHICLFNLFGWGPFLVLGPVIAERRLGGATSWGLVMALYGGGAVAGGLVMLGRLPRRPLLVATGAPLGWSLPSAALATGRSLPWVCGSALVAGAGISGVRHSLRDRHTAAGSAGHARPHQRLRLLRGIRSRPHRAGRRRADLHTPRHLGGPGLRGRVAGRGCHRGPDASLHTGRASRGVP